MKQIFVREHNIISSLGFTSEETLDNVSMGNSGIALHKDDSVLAVPFYASRISNDRIDHAFESLANGKSYTRLEKMLILSITDAARKANVNTASKDVLIIVSTTKGNIELMGAENKTGVPLERIRLSEMAKAVSEYFKNPNMPLVVSNACISGANAILVGRKMLEMDKYKSVIVSGADILSEFTVSGFFSFKALGSGPCRPYDESRDGISLGEGAATIVLDKERSRPVEVVVRSGAVSNDANHISGPSRTGEGLFIAVDKTLREAREVSAVDVGYICAHGTATLYNDEMEAKAFTTAGLNHIPLNSLKGYFGHTLGAAGLLESIITTECIKTGVVFKSLGYEKPGITVPLNIIKEKTKCVIDAALKTVSGFGGSNAAVLFTRE